MLPVAPLAVKPGPEMVVLEMLTLELPELVKATLKELLVPMVVLPKLKLEGLAVSCGVAVLTLVGATGATGDVGEPTASVAVPDVLAPLLESPAYVALSLCTPAVKLFTNQFSSATGVRLQFTGKPLSTMQSGPVGLTVPL
jgi:hypothetical protein